MAKRSLKNKEDGSEIPVIPEAEIPKLPEQPKIKISIDPVADEKSEKDRLAREKDSLDSAEAAKDKDYEAAYALLVKLGFTSAMIEAFWGNVSVEERKSNRGKGNGVSAKVLRTVRK